MKAGLLDRRVTILVRAEVQEEAYGTQQVTWVPLATVWAQVQDMLPSRADRAAQGIELTRRPARIRMRWRADVSTENRLKIGARVLRIVAGPAELGRREGIELVAEEISTLGQEP